MKSALFLVSFYYYCVHITTRLYKYRNVIRAVVTLGGGLRRSLVLAKSLRWQMFEHDSWFDQPRAHTHSHRQTSHWHWFGLVLTVLFRQLIYNRWMRWRNLLCFNGIQRHRILYEQPWRSNTSLELPTIISTYNITSHAFWTWFRLWHATRRLPNGV